MDSCTLPFDVLVDYWEGAADSATAERARLHLLGGCAVCSRRLDEIGRLLPALRKSGQFIHAPEPLISAASSLYRERHSNDRQPSLQVLIARLVYDSFRSPALTGARGDASRSCQRLFETDLHDVDIWEESLEDGSSYLIGQVFPRSGGPSIRPGRVELIQAGDTSVDSVPESSEFHLSPIKAGTYDLRLMLPDCNILLSHLRVGLG
ncbi:MAG TPA: hypothetical protein VGS41_01175 [Chthonomonadales bacterium]|nr:hypothetical protein [Chthonomonadales bacterium]